MTMSNRFRRKSILLLISSIAVLLFFSCSATPPVRTVPPESHAQEKPQEQDTADSETSNTVDTLSSKIPKLQANIRPEVRAAADLLLSSMTIEEKVAQVFVLSLREKGAMPKTFSPGGYVLFEENIKNPDQLRKLIEGLNRANRIPPFIGIDEEGGPVSRIGGNSAFQTTSLPAPARLGRANNTEAAVTGSKKLAEELKGLGISMNFAPLADINSNPDNPVIGIRSFGQSPDLVGRMVAAFVSGSIEGGVVPVIKHFPGHGDADTDSHFNRVLLMHDLERLRKFELPPFQAGIEAGAPAVMVGHLSLPEVTDTLDPAVMSSIMIEEILRKELGFDGLVITDAMDMGAITRFYPPGEAVLRAFSAGCDLIVMPENPQPAFLELISAVKQKEISEERLDRSVRRILEQKLRFGLFRMASTTE
ncbi:MAG: glycoside hydrolase family 3 protein [Spirochaetales bacterium]|nr:glycoside hydrolase family 3 protein [Spirochaetales bacterium]MCF7939045.1 glycoside hydrolase family 3 protein [Spirochaetales bacterium]